MFATWMIAEGIEFFSNAAKSLPDLAATTPRPSAGTAIAHNYRPPMRSDIGESPEIYGRSMGDRAIARRPRHRAIASSSGLIRGSSQWVTECWWAADNPAWPRAKELDAHFLSSTWTGVQSLGDGPSISSLQRSRKCWAGGSLSEIFSKFRQAPAKSFARQQRSPSA